MKVYSSEELSIPSQDISINKVNIIHGLGVPPDEVDPYLDSLLDSLISDAIPLAELQCSYSLFADPDFTSQTGMAVEEKTFSLGKMIFSALKNSSHAAFFIATAGDRIEKYSKEFMREGHALEGLIVDLIGSEIAEFGAGFIHQKIGQDMAVRNMYITNRYSPGYCGWPVSDQKLLFQLMAKACCSVQLTESSLMLPIKSVSGLIGVGTEVRNRGYACAKCDAEFCIYRDKK
ncbi:MAG: hypothetical protein JW801_14715 [Bacteroidales bacterium]|nr:hypothetical protein [Bacteroidales bacterium]